uniref:Uncharacterized protein n=1 Tax=Ciona intestinalis TaxID=7719 RepID=H2XNM1_CIOIN
MCSVQLEKNLLGAERDSVNTRRNLKTGDNNKTRVCGTGIAVKACVMRETRRRW